MNFVQLVWLQLVNWSALAAGMPGQLPDRRRTTAGMQGVRLKRLLLARYRRCQLVEEGDRYGQVAKEAGAATGWVVQLTPSKHITPLKMTATLTEAARLHGCRR